MTSEFHENSHPIARHQSPKHTAILGGGFSGTLMAINLLRYGEVNVSLIERHCDPGRGLAYSTAHKSHLLNVRAANMSAFPDQPNHFTDWLEQRGIEDCNAFVPRLIYGQYLAGLLDAARAAAPDRLEVFQDEVIALSPLPDAIKGAKVRCRSGREITADSVILALGNLPPTAPIALDPAALGDVYVGDPWSGDWSHSVAKDEHILVIGTGLTMVDVALLLEAKGFQGRITALSRRGLLPRVHAASSSALPPLQERPQGEVSELLRTVRARASLIGWRMAIDELRPFTKAMWLAATEQQKRRFLRHLRPWWDVHRHRLAPEIARRIEDMRASGRLRVVAGELQAIEPRGGRVEALWRVRGSERKERASISRVINCSGPQSDLLQSKHPVLMDLVAQGVAAPDPLGLGLMVDAQGRLISPDRAVRPIYAIGPMTRGIFWEITAVPDIRKQVWDLARRLCNAHWVGGEGL